MPEPIRFSVTQRVRYAETDAMGVAHHGSYLVWFEVGRVDCLRRAGFPYRRLESEGYSLPVSEVYCRYLRAARFDDAIQIETWLDIVKSRKIRLAYRVSLEETGEEIAGGYTEHICLKNGAVATIPDRLRDVLLPLVARPNDE